MGQRLPNCGAGATSDPQMTEREITERPGRGCSAPIYLLLVWRALGTKRPAASWRFQAPDPSACSNRLSTLAAVRRIAGGAGINRKRAHQEVYHLC